MQCLSTSSSVQCLQTDRRCLRQGVRRGVPVCSTSRRAATVETPSPQKSDVTAELLEGVIKMALRNRLKAHQSIHAAVHCDAWGVLEGKFRRIAISGMHWRTPLELTAHRLDVEMGEMQVDYAALVWRQVLALKNAPAGSVRISLSAADLGNFMTHPIFRHVAATAVHGAAFEFDKGSVSIQHSPVGEVRFEGVWGADQRRYRVAMRPAVAPAPAPAAAARGDGARSPVGAPARLAESRGNGSVSRGPQLMVAAQHLASEGEQPDEQGALRVASGLAHLFTHLHLDLEGIELRSPTLVLQQRDEARGDAGDLLDIALRMRMRAFPPLHMQF